MPERLIVVGNGFDIARGLKTKYSGFFTWLDKNYNTTADILSTGLTEISINNLFVTENLIKTKGLNFWYVYMSLLKLDDPEWNNVETKIKDVVTSIEQKNMTKALKTTLNLYSNFNSINITLKFIFSELLKFENLFSDYIDDKVLTSQHYDLSRSLIGDTDLKSIKVLNFNYTPIDRFIPENIRNIHGAITTDQHLIFGIDSTNIATFESSYVFTKTSRIMHSELIQNSPSIFSPSIKSVEFIGHSLNSSDYAYFQSIFDYLSIYNSDVELIFYFTSFHTENGTSRMAIYQDAIQTLLEDYGNSLDNKDHGDNLITKLLLENRLKMVKI